MFSRKINSAFLMSVLITIAFSAIGQNKPHNLSVTSVAQMRKYFAYQPNAVPLISGHRGGKVAGYPENSIAAFEHTLMHAPAFFEIDPRLTKDSVIVLMHDATLDRTTTGTGKLSDYTWEELKKLKLKDVQGNVTGYTIPTLEDAIKWSKGKTILNLDKKDVPLEVTARLMNKLKATGHVMLTVHSANEAKFYYSKNPGIMFSAFILKKETISEYEAAGVPWANIMAYIGPSIKPENKELIDLLHAKGVKCMISAASTYDKLQDDKRLAAYKEIINSQADVIESDMPIDVAKALDK